jgi:hypothetical protein
MQVVSSKERNKALDHSLKLKNIHLDLKDFTSAFFFVFHRSPTSLKIANEKDSAFMSFEKHEITASNYQFKKGMYL